MLSPMTLSILNVVFVASLLLSLKLDQVRKSGWADEMLVLIYCCPDMFTGVFPERMMLKAVFGSRFRTAWPK